MKKIIIGIVFILLVCSVVGCANTNDNIVFIGKIEEIYDTTILVTTSDDVGFDKAVVDISDIEEISFNLLVGRELEVAILPEIRESYPVQVTAVKLKLKK